MKMLHYLLIAALVALLGGNVAAAIQGGPLLHVLLALLAALCLLPRMAGAPCPADRGSNFLSTIVVVLCVLNTVMDFSLYSRSQEPLVLIQALTWMGVGLHYLLPCARIFVQGTNPRIDGDRDDSDQKDSDS